VTLSWSCHSEGDAADPEFITGADYDIVFVAHISDPVDSIAGAAV
jgi:hypothetical protein